MNQSKLDMAKQEMARFNTAILGISELKYMRTGKFNSDDHCIYYCGQEYIRRNWVSLIVNKKLQNVIPGFNLQNSKIIHFISKVNHSTSHNQSLCPTADAQEAEGDPFYED